MTEQHIAPPARVWEKIEQILDEQDRKKRVKHSGLQIFQQRNRNRISICFAAVGATILAGLVWFSK